MSNQVATTALPPPPARAAARARAVNDAFTQGVRDSFPTISFKGSKWSFKYQGNTYPHVDEKGFPKSYLEAVLIAASPALAKVYYEKSFAEGDLNPPDCWSVDSVKPDAGAPKKQSATCAGCPQNAFGSRISNSGKPAKACQDSRRVATALPGALDNPVGPMMLRVPQTSLKNLKDYAENLAGYGYPVNACVTMISFDTAEGYPKLTFQFGRPLTADEYDIVEQLEKDDRTQRILSAPVESAVAEGPDEPGQRTVQSYAQPPAPQSTSPPAPAASPPPPPSPASTPTPSPALSPAPAFMSDPQLAAGQPTPAQMGVDPPAQRAPRQRRARVDAPPAPTQTAAPSGPPPANPFTQFAAPPAFRPSTPTTTAPPAPSPAPTPPPMHNGSDTAVAQAPPGLANILSTLQPQ